jgi:hypothetical protein
MFQGATRGKRLRLLANCPDVPPIRLIHPPGQTPRVYLVRYINYIYYIYLYTLTISIGITYQDPFYSLYLSSLEQGRTDRTG